jgi:hypothetical protein
VLGFEPRSTLPDGDPEHSATRSSLRRSQVGWSRAKKQAEELLQDERLRRFPMTM